MIQVKSKGESLLFDLELHDVCHLSDCFPQVKPLFEQLELPVLYSRYIKRVLYHILQVDRAIVDNLKVLVHLLVLWSVSWKLL